jgi:hypothetical protein
MNDGDCPRQGSFYFFRSSIRVFSRLLHLSAPLPVSCASNAPLG